jgi:hypothetical protein
MYAYFKIMYNSNLHLEKWLFIATMICIQIPHIFLVA